MRKKPIAISEQLTQILIENLFRANKNYIKETDNNWYCLTAKYFIEAIDGVNSQLIDMIDKNTDLSIDRPCLKEKILEVMHAKKEEAMRIIKDWFLDNHDKLIYNMGKKIPWPVVQRLRSGLKIWIAGVSNPFTQPIEEMVMEVALDEGLSPCDAIEAWQAMGGELSKL